MKLAIVERNLCQTLALTLALTLLLPALALAAGPGLTLVSAGELRTTPAPLATSTVKPTNAPKIASTDSKPTKPMMIINAPPMKQKHLVPAAQQQKQTIQPAQLQSTLQVHDAKPLQVTGFITKAGNIYEVDGHNGAGIGIIEGRQAVDAGEQIICNYGNVVIYSDVPCDQVTNIRVGERQHLPSKNGDNANESAAAPNAEQPANEADQQQQQQQQLQEQQQQQPQEQENGEQNSANEEGNAPRQQTQQQRRRRRRRRPQRQQLQQQQKAGRRRRRNGNGVRVIRRRIRNGNGNGNGNANRRRVQQKRRGTANGQRRPSNGQQQQSQQQRRRRQQQQQQQRRRQQQRRGNSNANANGLRRRQQQQRRKVREDIAK